ncbi:MAG: TRAP transporter substrate-binding protein [Bacteroidota bacterium]
MLRRRPRLTVCSLALALSSVLLAACAPSTATNDSVTVLRLGHGLDTSHPVHQGMAYMAERLAVLSDGAMRIDLYPSEQLGSERQCLELLQLGSLAMTKVSASVLENFAPAFEVLTLPYLFRDEAHVWATLDGEIGQELLASPTDFRLRGLAYYDAGARSFYTIDRPVRSPADLDGMKIRTQESQTAMAMVRALGGSPTPISWGELYTALQQGVVDGAENNPPSFYLSRHYEVARYYALDEHTAVPDVLVVGTPTWDRLTAQEQAWLQQAARESTARQKDLWRAASEEALAAVREAGVEVLTVDKGPFRDRVAAMLDAYDDRPDLAALIARIQAVLDMSVDADTTVKASAAANDSVPEATP